MTGGRGRILSRGSVVFAASGFGLRVITLTANVLLRRWLTPVQFGLWNLVQVIVEFVNKFDLGSSSAIERDLPLELGRADHDRVSELQSSAIALVFAQGLLSALGVYLYFMMVARTGAVADTSLAWLGAAVLVGVTPTAVAARTVLQSHGRFDHAGYLSIAIGLLSTVATVIGAAAAGARGLVVGGVLAAVLGAGLSLVYLRGLGIVIEVRRWTRYAMARIVRFGLPLRVFDYPSSVFMSLDALAVAALYDRGQLAIYGTARLFSTVGQELASRLAAPARNQWRLELGRNPDSLLIQRGSLEVLALQALVIIPLGAVATFLGAEMVTFWLMPDYASSVPVLQVLVLTWLVLPHTHGIRDLWVVRGDFMWLFTTGLMGLGLFAVLFVGVRFLLGEPGLLTVAWIYFAAAAGYMTLLVVVVGREMWGGRTAAVALLVMAVGTTATWLGVRLAVLPATWTPWSDPLEPLSAALGGLAPGLATSLLWLRFRGRYRSDVTQVGEA